MRKILFVLILCNCALALADIAPSPNMIKQLKNEKAYKLLRCEDPKNLILCHFSLSSPGIDECHVYSEKPNEFKKLGRNGVSFGEEKYCARKGKDKS